MFHARRLLPWIPEHAVFIAGEIAKLDILDPHDAETFKSFYSKVLEEYRAANAVPEVVAEVTEVPVVVDVPTPEVKEVKTDIATETPVVTPTAPEIEKPKKKKKTL